MDWTVTWTEPAVCDLEAALRHAADASRTAAESLRVSILDAVALLARFPEIGPRYEPDRSGRTRETICGSYRIFYRLNDPARRVEILTLWHSSRREPRLPRA